MTGSYDVPVTHAGDRIPEPPERQARAARILDVAAELLLRHGYRRVTIDDIARGADIGKGTVYLHWRTREELFSAVFEREVQQAIGDLLGAVQRDRHGFLLHRVARTYFLVIMNRPLLRGFVLADDELLGKLARSGGAREDRHQLVSLSYFQLLADHGLLHPDLSPEVAAYAFLATFEGFLMAEASAYQSAPADLQRRADLLAVTVQRAFETGRELPPDTEDLLAQRGTDLFQGLLAAYQADPSGTA
jgi:AcrR family transcriptional regulator